MRARTTILLLLICSALGAYVYFYERFQTSTGDLERSAHLVLSLDQNEIDSITIKSTGGEVLITRINNGGANVWRVASPIQDRAEQAAVKAILKLASEFNVDRVVPSKDVASGEVKVVDLGLDGNNSVQVAFGSNGRTLATLLIGNAAPWKDTVYCKVLNDPDRSDIYVGSTTARPILLQPTEAFRDTFLAGIQFQNVLSVSIKQGDAAEIELKRDRAADDALWRLTKPLRTQADSDFVDKKLKRFLKARVDTFIPASPDVTPARSDAAIVLTFRTEDDKEATFTLEPPSDANSGSALARASDRDGGFLLNDEFHEMFAAPDESTPLWQELRSRKLGRIDPAKLTTVVLHWKGTLTMPVWLVAKSWYLKREGGIAEQADNGKIHGLVAGLNQVEIVGFTSDTGENLEAFGLDDPLIRLEFSTVEQTNPTECAPIPPESSVALLINKDAKTGRVYAKYEKEPFVYEVGPVVLGLLPQDPINWKDRSLMAFQQSSIQAIRITRPPLPPVDFIYDSAISQWKATRSGEDVTELLEANLVEQLRQRLAVFSVHDWASSFKPLDNLRSYTLEIRLIAKNFDGNEPEELTRILRFAPTTPGTRATAFYYGQLEGVPEPFRIRREAYDRLNAPLIGEKKKSAKPETGNAN